MSGAAALSGWKRGVFDYISVEAHRTYGCLGRFSYVFSIGPDGLFECCGLLCVLRLASGMLIGCWWAAAEGVFPARYPAADSPMCPWNGVAACQPFCAANDASDGTAICLPYVIDRLWRFTLGFHQFGFAR